MTQIIEITLFSSSDFYFTQHNVFKVHLCCRMHQDFLPFRAEYPAVWTHHILLSQSPPDGHLGYFHFLAIVNNADTESDISLGRCFRFIWIYTQKWCCWVI